MHFAAPKLWQHSFCTFVIIRNTDFVLNILESAEIQRATPVLEEQKQKFWIQRAYVQAALNMYGVGFDVVFFFSSF